MKYKFYCLKPVIETNAKFAFPCDLINRVTTGPVTSERIATLYIAIPTNLESLIYLSLRFLDSYARKRPKTRSRHLYPRINAKKIKFFKNVLKIEYYQSTFLDDYFHIIPILAKVLYLHRFQLVDPKKFKLLYPLFFCVVHTCK